LGGGRGASRGAAVGVVEIDEMKREEKRAGNSLLVRPSVNLFSVYNCGVWINTRAVGGLWRGLSEGPIIVRQDKLGISPSNPVHSFFPGARGEQCNVSFANSYISTRVHVALTSHRLDSRGLKCHAFFCAAASRSCSSMSLQSRHCISSMFQGKN